MTARSDAEVHVSMTETDLECVERMPARLEQWRHRMKCACNPVCRNYSTEAPYSPYMHDYCDPCTYARCDAHGYCQTVVYRRPVEPVEDTQ